MSNRRSSHETDVKVSEVAAGLSLRPETERIMTRSGDFPYAYETGAGKQSNHIWIPWSDVEDYRKKKPRVSR